MSGSSNKKLLETITSDFINPSLFDEKCECQINITIKIYEYESGDQFYYISYKYNYLYNGLPIEEIKAKHSHPFYGDKHLLDDHYEGDIIFKNSMSDIMIEYLITPNENLTDNIGSCTPEHYKVSIMRNIANLWD